MAGVFDLYIAAVGRARDLDVIARDVMYRQVDLAKPRVRRVPLPIVERRLVRERVGRDGFEVVAAIRALIRGQVG